MLADHFIESYIWAGFKKRCLHPPGGPQEERPSSQQPVVWKSRLAGRELDVTRPGCEQWSWTFRLGTNLKCEYLRILGLLGQSRSDENPCWRVRDKWSRGDGARPQTKIVTCLGWSNKMPRAQWIAFWPEQEGWSIHPPTSNPWGSRWAHQSWCSDSSSSACRGHRTQDLPAGQFPAGLVGGPDTDTESQGWRTTMCHGGWPLLN